MVCAAPASALPTRNMAIATSMTGLRPRTSASRPEKGRMAALASPYAAPTHTKSSPPCRSAVIVGAAVETEVKSSALRKWATATAMKESQNTEPLRGRASAVGPGVDEDMVAREWEQVGQQAGLLETAKTT